VYRRAWLVILSGFFEPLFYLLSLGVGLGSLVGTVTGPGGETVSYREFVAPAMLAASAMNGGVYETFTVYFKLNYEKLYDAVLATPLRPLDVVVAEILSAVLRGLTYSAVFLGVMVGLGLVGSWWAVLALPATVLIGFAFAAVGMAAASYFRSWQDLEWVNVVVLPMFLFSTTFYPLSTYPDWARPLVQATPLYQAVALVRQLTTGHVGLASLGHACYLAAFGLVGAAVAGRRVERLLLK
jgi:lipooligosaccharide transport system permease protein